MIAKERTIPIKILASEALLRRLPADFVMRPLIEKDLAKRKAGFRGEVATDYYVHKLPKKEFTILHDLRLSNGQDYFQIDTLIISPTFALILEIKNISGTLFFDSKFKQLIRYRNDSEDGFLNPISQADRQKRELLSWLLRYNVSIPIEFLVVISNPSTVIKSDSQNYFAFKNVLHAHGMTERVGKIKASYKKEVLTKREMNKLTKTLFKSHTPETFDVLNHYKISANSLVTGVQCTKCKEARMKRIYGSWQCTVCGHKERGAHKRALLDYYLLLGNKISNQQFRSFLQLSNEDISQKLLKSMELPHSGENKGRVYYLDIGLFQDIL
ncbi:NERD domain-containing protein [Bacillus sp. S/N-304-OC-R1]|uniref:NERD domain-containing protein n=1 Tax=Bacillus sp. S/N-304-OC-R1 TaxID=2758034 RepID=UPI001C8DB80C|nr:NERD domain-containing protein [Bacillus sp. S/N-304-OC-R1]MBY0123818.1 NERD domain-containing protein [Bacillus sp. S/N-304-OC-R1]